MGLWELEDGMGQPGVVIGWNVYNEFVEVRVSLPFTDKLFIHLFADSFRLRRPNVIVGSQLRNSTIGCIQLPGIRTVKTYITTGE